ncbi:MAG: efflux RND transporter periplasmic adaptor subunit [Planctomycetales bacterium]|nr:efflux RND transporter periplasmic adaptor subunit [Planctomycetales bacterium]
MPIPPGDKHSTSTGSGSTPKLGPTVEQLSLSLHASLDLQHVAIAIANDGRRFVDCDRLSVLVCDDSSCRLFAMSGVDAPDRRSNLISLIEQSADAVLRQKLPVWRRAPLGDPWPSQADQREISDALTSLQSETGAPVICVVSVGEPDPKDIQVGSGSVTARTERPIGALVCEWFTPNPTADGASAAIETLRRVAGLALRNAGDYDRVPLRASLLRVRSVADALRRRRTWITVAVLVAIVAALVVIPIELTVTAHGELQPTQRRDVFAPADGIVSDIRMQYGQSVAIDDLLVTLHNSDLDFEDSRIAGESQTARKRLAAVQAARVELQQQAVPSRERANQLSSDEEELKELLISLDQQRGLVVRRQAELQVRSPLAGQVITWDVRQLLASRPVQRGQVLLTVANPDGPWELRLHVTENDIGHVLAARRSGNENLAMKFVLATQPGTEYAARVAGVSLATDVHERLGAGVPVVATFDRDSSLSPRPGAAVIANIRCGQRAAGFVLFHRVFEAVRRWGWF